MNAIATATPTVGAVEIELGLVNSSTLSNPDKIVLTFSDHLLTQLAKIQAGLLAMNIGHAEVTIPLPDDLQMFEGGEEWIQDDKESGDGSFEPSSTWLKVQKNSLAIEIWDEHADDELHGQVNINDVPGLADELARRAAAAVRALSARLT